MFDAQAQVHSSAVTAEGHGRGAGGGRVGIRGGSGSAGVGVLLLMPRHEHHLLLLRLLPQAGLVESRHGDAPRALPEAAVRDEAGCLWLMCVFVKGQRRERWGFVSGLTYMCRCRSLVSKMLLLRCLANMQPTFTAFSMNSSASVCNAHTVKRTKSVKRTPKKKRICKDHAPERRGGLSRRSNNAHLQHALHVGIKRVRAAGARDRQAVPHAAAQDAEGA